MLGLELARRCAQNQSLARRAKSSCTLLPLIDQRNGPRAVIRADRWRLASSPVVKCITHCGEIGRGYTGTREGLVPSAVAGQKLTVASGEWCVSLTPPAPISRWQIRSVCDNDR